MLFSETKAQFRRRLILFVFILFLIFSSISRKNSTPWSVLKMTTYVKTLSRYWGLTFLYLHLHSQLILKMWCWAYVPGPYPCRAKNRSGMDISGYVTLGSFSWNLELKNTPENLDHSDTGTGQRSQPAQVAIGTLRDLMAGKADCKKITRKIVSVTGPSFEGSVQQTSNR